MEASPDSLPEAITYLDYFTCFPPCSRITLTAECTACEDRRDSAKAFAVSSEPHSSVFEFVK